MLLGLTQLFMPNVLGLRILDTLPWIHKTDTLSRVELVFLVAETFVQMGL